jgi:hypothetical protein
VLEQASGAVQAEKTGAQVTDSQWSGLKKVLAGILPDWLVNSQGKKASDGLLPDALMPCMMNAQIAASKQVEEQLRETRKVAAHIQKREKLRTRMQLVFRAWREEVEHSAEGVLGQPSKWKVRRAQDTARQDGSIQRGKIPISKSAEKHNEHTKAQMGDEQGEDTLEQPTEDEPTLLQKVDAILTCLRVSITRKTKETVAVNSQQKAIGRWKRLGENLTCTVEKMKRMEGTEAKTTSAKARNSRATDREEKPDYMQTRKYIKKTTAIEKPMGQKRRESTKQATQVGMELQRWMKTVGEQNMELWKPKGIG